MRRICLLAPLLLLLPPVSGQLRTTGILHYKDQKTWKEAQDFCRKHHIDLITITDEMEKQKKQIHGWIGSLWRDLDDLWKWSREDEIVFLPSDAGQESCGYMVNNNFDFHYGKCDEKRNFTCYDENLILVKKKKTWEEALEHCRALRALDPSRPATDYQNHRYDLVTLLTDDDHKFAAEKAKKSNTTAVWTGLRFLAGQWLWVGGERMQYTGTDSCPHVEKCGVVDKLYPKELGTRDCKLENEFFCYKKTRNYSP